MNPTCTTTVPTHGEAQKPSSAGRLHCVLNKYRPLGLDLPPRPPTHTPLVPCTTRVHPTTSATEYNEVYRYHNLMDTIPVVVLSPKKANFIQD